MDNNFYENFDRNSSKNSTFFPKILLPFISGALGASLVIGIFFGTANNSLNKNSTNKTPTTITTSTGPSLQQISLTEYSDTSIYAAKKALPSIVGIEVEFTVNSYFGSSQTSKAQGSGIIISQDGYILTNNHIISSSDSSYYYEVSKANSVKVSLYDDETKYDAKIIGTDSLTDLAVIKIEKDGLVAAELGDSSSAQIGEFVLAVGNPLGLQSSVTGGIISALNREITTTDGTSYVVIQTDAAINSGNSGGALVNSEGKVIGINTLKLSGTGIEGMGFAIPINDTIKVYTELIDHGKISRPFIGISGIDLTEKQADYYHLPVGIYVQSIEITSAAEAAGLKVGDVIVKADGTEVKNMDELNKIKNKKNIGDTIVLTIVRDGKEHDVTLTLKEQP